MIPYATVAEALHVAHELAKDVVFTDSGDTANYVPNTNTVSTVTVEGVILEATARVRGLLRPHYDPATIDAEDPMFPPMVVTTTAVIAAEMLYSRFITLNPDSIDRVRAEMWRAVDAFRRQVSGLCLEDVAGVLITPVSGPSSLSGGADYQAYARSSKWVTRIRRYAR